MAPYLFGALVGFIVLMAFVATRKARYRGAIGFKNRHSVELMSIRVTGFSDPVQCGTLAPGEHSFNFPGRQEIPAEVKIAWRQAGETSDMTAAISLKSVPADARDGEIFFVRQNDGAWTVEYSPRLRM